MSRDEDGYISFNCNDSMIDEIFDNKVLDYEDYLFREKKGEGKRGSVYRVLNTLEECYMDKIPKKSQKIIRECYDKIDREWSKELEFWQREFYRLGFVDGFKTKEDIRNAPIIENKNNLKRDE